MKIPRQHMPEQELQVRSRNFLKCRSFDAETAMREASRCLE